jgi:hypothetical protein
MPSYAQVLTDAYLPAQAAKLRWESAKAVAGAQFDALAEQRRAVDDVRLRSQLYAQNIRPNEAGTDAFIFQAVQAMAGTPAPTAGRGGGGPSPAFRSALNVVQGLPTGSDQFRTGSPSLSAVQRAADQARTVEQFNALKAAAQTKGFTGQLVQPPGLTTEAKLKERAQAGDRAAQAQYTQAVGSNQALLDLADNLGPRGFQGGLKAREFYDALSGEQQELARVYASALLDDGVATADELPEGQLEDARKLHEQIKAKGAYRLQDKAAFDQGYLDLLKDVSAKESGLAEAEGRLQGKTKETLAEELYTGASERAAIPPLLRSLEPEMKRYLDGFTAAQAADAKADPESYLKSQLSEREAKGFAAASAMAASGMRAAEIMDNLQALSPEERRSVMGALASRDAIASTQMKVAPGTPLPEIEKIQAEDRRAQEAELARTESRLQRRLRQLDESLAVGRESGFGGLVSPDTGARRQVLMGALSPEEAATQARAADEAEVERIAAEQDLARIEDVRRRDPDDPASELQSAVAPRLDSNRGDITAGDEDRVARASQMAQDAAARVEGARREFSQAVDPRDAAAVRSALMQGLEPVKSVGPTRADLRQDYEITGAPKSVVPREEDELVFGGGVIRNLRDMTDEELAAALQGVR